MARSYADLRTIVEALEAGTEFTIQLEMNTLIVGSGDYLKTPEGIQVIHESAACERLLQ